MRASLFFCAYLYVYVKSWAFSMHIRIYINMRTCVGSRQKIFLFLILLFGQSLVCCWLLVECWTLCMNFEWSEYILNKCWCSIYHPQPTDHYQIHTGYLIFFFNIKSTQCMINRLFWEKVVAMLPIKVRPNSTGSKADTISFDDFWINKEDEKFPHKNVVARTFTFHILK